MRRRSARGANGLDAPALSLDNDAMPRWVGPLLGSLVLHATVLIPGMMRLPAAEIKKAGDAAVFAVQWEPLVWIPSSEPVPGPALAEPPQTPLSPIPIVSGGRLARAVLDAPRNPPIPYPREALVRGWEGRVLLEVLVLASGECGEVKIHESSGHWVLDRQAATSVQQWRFRPARQLGYPVTQWALLPVRFQVRESGGVAGGP